MKWMMPPPGVMMTIVLGTLGFSIAAFAMALVALIGSR